MARTVVVDSGFLVALLSRNDRYRTWATAQASQHNHPWLTCDAVLSECFHLIVGRGEAQLREFLRRGIVLPAFDLGKELAHVLDLMDKYSDVPMSLADACLVRLAETLSDPLILTTDADFRIYRRHRRQVVPCALP